VSINDDLSWAGRVLRPGGTVTPDGVAASQAGDKIECGVDGAGTRKVSVGHRHKREARCAPADRTAARVSCPKSVRQRALETVVAVLPDCRGASPSELLPF
jgi:hypothetical protein